MTIKLKKRVLPIKIISAGVGNLFGWDSHIFNIF